MPLQLLRVGLLRSPDFQVGGTLRPELPDYPVKSSTASLLQTHVTLTGVTLALGSVWSSELAQWHRPGQVDHWQLMLWEEAAGLLAVERP